MHPWNLMKIYSDRKLGKETTDSRGQWKNREELSCISVWNDKGLVGTRSYSAVTCSIGGRGIVASGRVEWGGVREMVVAVWSSARKRDGYKGWKGRDKRW